MTARFTAKEKARFRKLLEVANSTTYQGERDAALHAATRLASSRGMSLREAAGMGEERDSPPPRGHNTRKPHGRPAGFPADFGAAEPNFMGRWWTERRGNDRSKAADGYHSEVDRYAAEKRRHAEAMADALQRGLDADERRAAEIKARRAEKLRQRGGTRPNRNSWRPRPEFVRVLLAETNMSAREIAAVAGVTIYDVFREKLLMRPRKAAQPVTA